MTSAETDKLGLASTRRSLPEQEHRDEVKTVRKPTDGQLYNDHKEILESDCFNDEQNSQRASKREVSKQDQNQDSQSVARDSKRESERKETNDSNQPFVSPLDQTFNKFEAEFHMHGKTFYLAKSSLNLFGEKNKLRRALVWLVKWNWFENFIILCIVANSILLALKDYSDYYKSDFDAQWNNTIDQIDNVFTYIFIAECIFKILALGLYSHNNSYLREGWNVMDFFIVGISLLSVLNLGNNDELKALRTMRILRPLKTISSLPSMRKLIKTFFISIPGLANVFMFLTFFFAIFAIFGVISFQGEQYNFCRESETAYEDEG